jgi:PleD family two-component response regulator
MNFGRFTEQLESFLALEQRGRWSAVGLVDITGFKWYNDAFGHAVGDRIIQRVAQLLREQIRSDDLIAQERPAGDPERADPITVRGRDLHARFGGDEFCFLIPDLVEYPQAYTVAERFREAVERHDWSLDDRRLAAQPVRVDVGVVCLWMGRVAERRFIARRLAAALIQRADQLMYGAKGERASHIYLVRTKVVNGALVDVTDGENVELAGVEEEKPEA